MATGLRLVFGQPLLQVPVVATIIVHLTFKSHHYSSLTAPASRATSAVSQTLLTLIYLKRLCCYSIIYPHI
jgi:hypothetical protein